MKLVPSTFNYIANLSDEGTSSPGSAPSMTWAVTSDHLSFKPTPRCGCGSRMSMSAMPHASGGMGEARSFCLPSASAHHGGDCYVSSNNSLLCVVRTGDQQFNAAITTRRSVQPTVFAFHRFDFWRGAGVMPKENDSGCRSHLL